MPTLTLTLPEPHAGQQQVIREAQRFNVLACGRRFGKTTLGIDRCVAPEVLRYPVGWFSPTYKMLLEVWREASRRLAPVTTRSNSSDHRIENMVGGVLEFWSLENPDSARGRKYRRIIVDEAAMVPTLMDAWQYVLRSTLVDYSGDAWFLSTPKGRNGFWQMWQWGQDPADPEWRSWQMPSSANPLLKSSELDAMRQTMPERVYSQEIEALFLEDAGGVFRRIADAATAQLQERAQEGHDYAVGVDWGRSGDYTVIAVLDITTNELVHLDRFTQINYNVQLGRLRAVCDRFHPITIIAEANSMGGPLTESLQRMNLPVRPFTTTNATKGAIIDALALAFEQGSLRIISDPVLVAELQAYEMDKLPSGLYRYSAPEGMHDDCVISLALAWQAAATRMSSYVDFA